MLTPRASGWGWGGRVETGNWKLLFLLWLICLPSSDKMANIGKLFTIVFSFFLYFIPVYFLFLLLCQRDNRITEPPSTPPLLRLLLFLHLLLLLIGGALRSAGKATLSSLSGPFPSFDPRWRNEGSGVERELSGPLSSIPLSVLCLCCSAQTQKFFF